MFRRCVVFGALLVIPTLAMPLASQEPPPSAATKTQSSTGQSQRIGQVKDVQGQWCRKRSKSEGRAPLARNDVLYLDDDVRYCRAKVVRQDKIVVLFDANPPRVGYERPYECSTPGICEDKTALWLKGGYLFGPLPSPHGTSLESQPKLLLTSPPKIPYQIPDAVIKETSDGARPPAEIKALLKRWPTDSPRHFLLCPVSLAGFVDAKCVREISINSDELTEGPVQASTFDESPDTKWYLPPPDLGGFKIRLHHTALPRISLPPGLYAVYPSSYFADANYAATVSFDEAPEALWLVTDAQSDSVKEWQSVPKPFRVDSDAASVTERRRFILDLAQSAK